MRLLHREQSDLGPYCLHASNIINLMINGKIAADVTGQQSTFQLCFLLAISVARLFTLVSSNLILEFYLISWKSVWILIIWI